MAAPRAILKRPSWVPPGYPPPGYPHSDCPQPAYTHPSYPPIGYPPAGHVMMENPNIWYPPVGPPPTGLSPMGYPPAGSFPVGHHTGHPTGPPVVFVDWRPPCKWWDKCVRPDCWFAHPVKPIITPIVPPPTPPAPPPDMSLFPKNPNAICANGVSCRGKDSSCPISRHVHCDVTRHYARGCVKNGKVSGPEFLLEVCTQCTDDDCHLAHSNVHTPPSKCVNTTYCIRGCVYGCVPDCPYNHMKSCEEWTKWRRNVDPNPRCTCTPK